MPLRNVTFEMKLRSEISEVTLRKNLKKIVKKGHYVTSEMVFLCSKPCIFVPETVISDPTNRTIEDISGFLGGLGATKGTIRAIFKVNQGC
jgi:hypothetical protein